MKKILIALTIVISCLGISRVKAETYNVPYSNVYEGHTYNIVTDYSYLKKLGYDDEVQELYNLTIKKYNEEYFSTYPYFYISISAKMVDRSFDEVDTVALGLLMYSEIPISDSYHIPSTTTFIVSSYDVLSSTYNLPDASINQGVSSSSSYVDTFRYNQLAFFISNFSHTVNGEHSFNVTGNSNFTINPGDVIKPIFTAENAFQTNYIEINLNDYAYVALTLKDYNQEPFSTQVHVKGNYCLTPVYNYGMTERKDILTGSQVERCSPYYDNYTPVRTYIIESDLKNNSIYYLKAYDTSKDNSIKVDSSIFDITYITEENKDNPYVTIGSKIYPTIPYDNLADTATKSEDEGYVSGAVEEFSFSDIFTAPLEFLKDIWDSIASVFDLVKEFFSLLPEPIPSFLLTSFMLAVALGLLKIIL